jgi:hypothetical protein
MNLSGSQDKPTLALTIPRSNQVVYKGFPSAILIFAIRQLDATPLPVPTRSPTRYDPESEDYPKNASHSRLNISSISSQASGLEAFSRYPTHDSFSAMPGRATEFTSHANQRFLSYWAELLSRRTSRISVG